MAQSKNCPWCGRENAQEAESCFACGTPLMGHEDFNEPVRARTEARRRTRKTWLIAVIAFIIVAAAAVVVWLLVGNGDTPAAGAGPGEQSGTTAPSAVTSEESTTTTSELLDLIPVAAFGATQELWQTVMTVGAPEILTDAALEELLGADVDLYIVYVKITNSGDELRDYNLFYWTASDADGSSYDASLYVENQALDSGDIEPGQTVEGYVGFELPKGKAVVSVSYSPLLADGTAVWETGD